MQVKNKQDLSASGDWLTSLMNRGADIPVCHLSDRQTGMSAPQNEDRTPIVATQPPPRPGRGKIFWLLAVGLLVLTASQLTTAFFLVQRGSQHEPVIVKTDPKTEPKPEPAQAPRTEIVVASDGGDYQSLTQALSQAKPGMRIRVKPGLYKESLVIDKPIEIIGDGPAKDIIIESANADCLAIKSDGVLIRGLSLRTKTEIKDGQFFALHVTQGRPRVENCDLTSESKACVGVHGPEANPTLVGCTIHDCKAGDGVLVYDQGKGIYQGCQIVGNGRDGLVVLSRGNPVVTGCVLRDNKRDGAAIDIGGLGLLVDCIIADNTGSGVWIGGKDSNPMVRNCVIRNGKSNGVVVFKDGAGTLEGCQIHDNKSANVAIVEGAKLTVHSCNIFGGKNAGIFVRGGWGLVSGCDIHGHADVGIAVAKEGKLAVFQCQLHDDKNGSWQVSSDSSVTGTGNQPPQPASAAVGRMEGDMPILLPILQDTPPKKELPK